MKDMTEGEKEFLEMSEEEMKFLLQLMEGE